MGRSNDYILDPSELELLISMDRAPNSMSGGGCPAHVYRSTDVEVACAIVCPTSGVDLADLSFESCPCRLAFIVDSSARAARASKMYCATSTLLSVTSDDTDEWTTVPCSTEAQAIVRMYISDAPSEEPDFSERVRWGPPDNGDPGGRGDAVHSNACQHQAANYLSR